MAPSVRQEGYVASVVVRLILLFVVLAEVCFLASRYRARVDLTSDQLYTLTASTQKVLSKLEDRLLVEAYFSPKQNLPILDQPKRMALVNLLEEYEKLSQGAVKVQFIDPLEDKTRRETASRLGMTPQHARVHSAGNVTAMDIWQGIRIRYGAEKQEVIPYMPFPPDGQHSTAFYEKILTPLIKRLSTAERTKIGVLAFRSRPGGGGMTLSMEEKTPPQGFNNIIRIFSRDYDMTPIDIGKGQLIPAEIRIALLIRPKYLSDRTKFVFDQFLMRGGQLVVFADTAEIEVRSDRAVRGTVVPYDAAPAKLKFADMLKHYGVEVRNQIVGEGVHALQQPFFELQQEQRTGQRVQNMIRYPYMFEAHDSDWKDYVQGMARNAKGEVEAPLARQYREKVQPGMNTDHELIKVIAPMGAPGMFWPCPVGLLDTLPEGVTGSVLLRSSPLSWTEPPNAALDPFAEAPHLQQRLQNVRRWTTAQENRRPATPRQFPLMVHVKGTFPSFFADKPVPPRPADPADAANGPKRKPDEDWGEDPKKPKDDALPAPAPAQQAEPEEVEARLMRAPPTANLIVIGDATFIRDDFISGQYAQPSTKHMIPIVGPFDRQAQRMSRPSVFLKNLFDWLAEERDLQELINKQRTDRVMRFVERDEVRQETDDEFRERLSAKTSFVRWVNVLAPVLTLFAFGMGIWFTRRAKKRAFLASL